MDLGIVCLGKIAEVAHWLSINVSVFLKISPSSMAAFGRICLFEICISHREPTPLWGSQ